jgi:hypothetical protein
MAFLCDANDANADSQSMFVVELTHAIYAKGLCRIVSIPYEDLAKLADAKGLDPTIIEDVQGGLAYLNSAGKSGERAPQDVMVGVTVAANVIAFDQSQLGTTAWCKARAPSLLQDGFITTVEPAAAKDQ